MSEHPEEEEINNMLNLAAEKIGTLYEVAFEITRYDAELLIDYWSDATSGDVDAVYALMTEMGKLVEVLKEQILEEDEDGSDTGF